VLGEGDNREFLNRVSIIYDTRDDIIIPSKGEQFVVYGGIAARNGAFNDSLYTEAGFDGRAFIPVGSRMVLASHMGLRYLPDAHDVPFWALSSIGGADTVVGGQQPLRGFGDGRFYDRNSFSGSVELRRNMVTFNAVSTSAACSIGPALCRSSSFTRFTGWDFAASRGLSSSAMWTSATGARAPRCSRV
jgi:outer membrane protein assembly factor BamA